MPSNSSLQKNSVLKLPEISVRIRSSIGEIAHIFRAESECSIQKIQPIKVSARKTEQLYILDSGEALIIGDKGIKSRPKQADGVLIQIADGSLKWDSHKLIDEIKDGDEKKLLNLKSSIQTSWTTGIRYKQEIKNDAGTVITNGLRPPQIGAVHAIGAHWSLKKAPATIVMPTGTGKTEAMIATMVELSRGTFLVIVPSNPLRHQTAAKFKNLGLLRVLGIVSEEMKNPIIGVITKRPRTEDDLKIFDKCNVVISTMSALGQGTALNLLSQIPQKVDSLIVDEAHHIAARTWADFRTQFTDKPVLQFTATPYRRDGYIVDGEVIYSYPLSNAQKDGYFKPIVFDPVYEIDLTKADQKIANRAIEKLRQDIDEGFDHIVMARCKTIDRATAILDIYKEVAPDLNPIVVHSEGVDSRSEIEKIKSRESRVVVCVDMLGEGFDLPQLKIAAVHDTHKSLSVLLQFTGRFTRTASDDIGTATVIANVADQDVSNGLERLYSEDADWNQLLSEYSSAAIQDHQELISFLKESVRLDSAEERESFSISPSLLRPKFSAVVYRCKDFLPKRFYSGIPESTEIHRVWLNNKTNTLYFVTKMEEGVAWSRSKQIIDRQWDLFVLHYDISNKLLYIHSSDKTSLHENLARAVCSETPELFRGEQVFRVLANINRLKFQNLGISKHGRRNLRYSMYTGADVTTALTASQTAGSVKTNLTGTGYENGEPVSVGCSYKGRIWSRDQGPIRKFIKWCASNSQKLTNNSINTVDIIKNVLIQEEATSIPNAFVIGLEWPNELLNQSEERIIISYGREEHPISMFELVFDQVNDSRNAINFFVKSDHVSARYSLTLNNDRGFIVTHVEGELLNIQIGKIKNTISDFFSDYPPFIKFSDMSELDGNLLIKPQQQQLLAFPRQNISAWDWSGVDVSKESMWKDQQNRPDSIQARAVDYFSRDDFDVIFNDDSSGEAADLICIKNEENHLSLVLVHCKFSHSVSGKRVKDVVEVSTQAIRSARWVWNFSGLCRHISARESRLRTPARVTRFIKGNENELSKIRKASLVKEMRTRIIVIQPGLSKSSCTDEQLSVLAAAHSFIKDTVDVSLEVISGE